VVTSAKGSSLYPDADLGFLLFAVGQENLSLQPGQSIYVVATKSDTKIDITAEATVRTEFEKRKKFKIGNAATNADFVFLVLTEYESYSSGFLVLTGVQGPQRYLRGAIAMAIPSKEYAEHKDDLEKLREVSVWQSALASSEFKRGVSLTKLVKDFHRQFERK
jgi:hypothetical protein